MFLPEGMAALLLASLVFARCLPCASVPRASIPVMVPWFLLRSSWGLKCEIREQRAKYFLQSCCQCLMPTRHVPGGSTMREPLSWRHHLSAGGSLIFAPSPDEKMVARSECNRGPENGPNVLPSWIQRHLECLEYLLAVNPLRPGPVKPQLPK